MPMFRHEDRLGALSSDKPLKEKLIYVHQLIQEEMPFIARISVALYDAKTSAVKTYMHSSGQEDPLSHYQIPLDDAPSLKEIFNLGRPRVVNNFAPFGRALQEHSQRIGRSNYGASYTRPILFNSTFVGFLFFNSLETEVFTENVLNQLDLYGHMISLQIINELATTHILTATIKTALHMSHFRDPETGSHLDRMSRYARLIAASLAKKYHYDDNYVEHVYSFAPLHDIGKIAIPDHILLKPAPLDARELAIMKTHVSIGREMIDNIMKYFDLGNLENIDILRNIVEFHHEAVDGSGYPAGLRENRIPLEARIVTVADVFDALTSRRPYKSAWSNQEAFSWLQQMAGKKFDKDCVESLVANRESIELIQQQFQDDYQQFQTRSFDYPHWKPQSGSLSSISPVFLEC
ncbi:MAG: HD-GYP domain-containing protein [Methylomicrobium sp.]